MKQGILIAEDGGNIENGDVRYRSDRQHMQIDMTKTPKHMDTLNITGGTALVDSGYDEKTQREVLFGMEHGYDFSPYCLAFFYVSSVDFDESGSTDPMTRTYSDNLAIIRTDQPVDDYVQIEVDDKFFRIVHILKSYGADSGYSSLAPQYHYRIKYYVTSLALRSL